MPTITAIQPQVRSENRVNVHLDGKYWISLDIQQVVDLGIRMGLQIDELQKASIEKESSFGKAYAAALNYVSIRIRSEKEIRDYGFRKRWEPELTERVLERLKVKGYLNDAEFARRWAENRQLSKPMSKRRLMQELMKKGIYGEELNVATEDFDEVPLIDRLIEKKAKKYADDREKFIGYLQRQGFSYDVIKDALTRYDERVDEPSV